MRIFAGIILFSLSLTGCLSNDVRSQVTLPFSKVNFSTASKDVSLWSYRYKISGMNPSALAMIDAFHHGVQDIVVANAGSSSISLFKNLGNGTFKEVAVFNGCAGGSDIDAEDLTGDGYDDFLVTCPENNVVSLFIGDGKGNFDRHDIPVAQGIVKAQAAPHVDQPGTPFLTILHDSPAKMDLFSNQGSGNFVFSKELPVSAAPTAFVSDRFTKDGSISYAVVSSVGSKFSVYSNHQNQFERKDYSAPEAASSIETLDMRQLGIMDLAVTSGTQNLFRIYFNDGDGNFPCYDEYTVPGGSISGLGSSHLRGKTQEELIAQVNTTGDIVIYPSLGNGKLGNPEVIHAGSNLIGLATGNFIHQSDGMDIALIDSQTSELVILLNEKDNY